MGLHIPRPIRRVFQRRRRERIITAEPADHGRQYQACQGGHSDGDRSLPQRLPTNWYCLGCGSSLVVHLDFSHDCTPLWGRRGTPQ